MNSTPALRIKSLQKNFGTFEAVKNLDLTIEEGEVFGLLGPNGAGKSTTINLIAGVCVIEKGLIEVFGYNCKSHYQITRRLTGVMHQEVIVEQAYPIGQALKLHSGFFGVKDDPKWRQTLIDRLDLGPHLQKKMMRLSGGMKRRFMVAKALIHKPRFLILDEPTAGVDVELRRGLWDFMREINKKGTTILLTTHYLEEAEKMCGRLAIMNRGKIIALNHTQDLIKDIEHQRLKARLSLPPSSNFMSKHVGRRGNWNPETHVLTVGVRETQEIQVMLSELQRERVMVQEMEVLKPDLEDVFVKLTSEFEGPAS